MKLADARRYAQTITELLGPYCERLQVAGSIRRGAEECRDLELVIIPRSSDLLKLADVVNKWPKKKGDVNGRYTRRSLGAPAGTEFCLDLFICSPATWACNLLIRTGSASFSKGVVIHAQSQGFQFKDAQLWRGPGEWHLVPTPEEADVFRALGLVHLEPHARQSQYSLKFLEGSRVAL